MQFGIPRSITSNLDTRFLNVFYILLLDNLDTKLKRFHKLMGILTKLVNRTLVHLLRGYNQKLENL